MSSVKWRPFCFGLQCNIHTLFRYVYCQSLAIMMTSSNGNIFRVTGHFCGEFTGHRWIPRTKASYAELWCEAGDLRRHRAHYDATVMYSEIFTHFPQGDFTGTERVIRLSSMKTRYKSYNYHDDVIKWKHFRVTGHLCAEFTGPRWIPRTKACDAELWCFLSSALE